MAERLPSTSRSDTSSPRRDVPCNGCTLCCDHDLIRLEFEDDLSRYQTEPHPGVPSARMLAHKPDGSCIYMRADGCDIHDHAPLLCRVADCRGLAARLDFDTAMMMHKIGQLDIRVWDKGRELLERMSNQRT